MLYNRKEKYMLALTIENLREVERLLKNAYRATRAASYSETGSIEPLYTNKLDPIGYGISPDIAAIRAVILGSSDIYDAAKNVVETISDYIQ